MHATQAVDEEGDTDEESSAEGCVCGVEWECELNGAGDEHDDVLGMGIRNHGQRKFKVRMTDGHVAGSTWQVADVKRLLMSVAKRSQPGIVCISIIPLRHAGNVFVIGLRVRNDVISRKPGFHRQA